VKFNLYATWNLWDDATRSKALHSFGTVKGLWKYTKKNNATADNSQSHHSTGQTCIISYVCSLKRVKMQRERARTLFRKNSPFNCYSRNSFRRLYRYNMPNFSKSIFLLWCTGQMWSFLWHDSLHHTYCPMMCTTFGTNQNNYLVQCYATVNQTNLIIFAISY
jgi:hypothetical protein